MAEYVEEPGWEIPTETPPLEGPRKYDFRERIQHLGGLDEQNFSESDFDAQKILIPNKWAQDLRAIVAKSEDGEIVGDQERRLWHGFAGYYFSQKVENTRLKENIDRSLTDTEEGEIHLFHTPPRTGQVDDPTR